MKQQVIEVIFDIDNIYPKVDYSFRYGRSRVVFFSNDERKVFNLKIIGVGNISMQRMKERFFIIYELLFFTFGFFPPIKSMLLNGDDADAYVRGISKKFKTAKVLIHPQSSFFHLSPSTVNSDTVKRYIELRKEISLPLDSFFATQSYEDTQIFGEHRFVLAAHAAEGIVETKYDCEIESPPGYMKRIRFFFKPLLEADKKNRTRLIRSLGISRKTFFKLFKNTRDFYSHLCKERKRFREGTGFIAEYYIIVIAFRLFILEKINIAYHPKMFALYISLITEWIRKYR